MTTITEYFKPHKSRTDRKKKEVPKSVIKDEVEQIETVDPSTKELELLRQFDLDSKFGPCTGISRLQRWDRAAKFGFDPPVEIREIILQHKDNIKYSESIWYGLKV